MFTGLVEYLGRIESIERGAIVLAFPQNRIPAQTGLRAFEHQELEQHAIIMLRNTPLAIVILDGQLIPRPSTPHGVSCRWSFHHGILAKHDTRESLWRESDRFGTTRGKGGLRAAPFKGNSPPGTMSLRSTRTDTLPARG